ncbi:MAG: hypothetical protein AVDCRST_MAG59-1944 [uncultured Thermomicrobiales bacterium]|uniref:Uncharacterized protein n=1 Tax=uncultured Thermomicrobiales bacterium TaxID=1645740 RepID=A0A6J4UPJ5_9BACT|nr:MAG: hypothetical protein AVDCRST_MAG59-1944 [uncultured Thermomicrobiales bacterium]
MSRPVASRSRCRHDLRRHKVVVRRCPESTTPPPSVHDLRSPAWTVARLRSVPIASFLPYPRPDRPSSLGGEIDPRRGQGGPFPQRARGLKPCRGGSDDRDATGHPLPARAPPRPLARRRRPLGGALLDPPPRPLPGARPLRPLRGHPRRRPVPGGDTGRGDDRPGLDRHQQR